MARGIALGLFVVLAAALAALTLSPRIPHPKAMVTTQLAPSPSPPSPSPSPASPAPALVDYGPPPAGLPVIYGSDPSNQLWITAFDWQGRPRGTIKLTGPLTHELVVEPHCYVLEDQQTFDEVLYTVLDGQAPRRIGVIVNEGSLGQTGVEAVECNFQAGLAIAVRTAVLAPSDTWALRLSDGTIRGHWSYAGTGVSSIVPSSDGKLIAESGAQSTRIRSIPDGAIVGTLPAAAVYAFSGDDRFVLEGPAGQAAPMRLVDWRTGRQLWQSAGNGWPEAQVETGTGDIAVAVASQDQWFSVSQDPAKPIIIIHADGTETDLPGRYVPLFPPYADGYYPYKGGPP